MSQQDSRPEETIIPLLEESVSIAKRRTLVGKVRVRTRTAVSEETAQASLMEERADVWRVPVGREVDMAPAVRTEGDVTIIPILEEVLVVEKRLVLKEELHIRKTVAHEDVAVPVSLRRQYAEVERASAQNGNQNPEQE
jgi:uncharacterized protein (TIGR02271 family)